MSIYLFFIIYTYIKFGSIRLILMLFILIHYIICLRCVKDYVTYISVITQYLSRIVLVSFMSDVEATNLSARIVLTV